MKAYAYSDRRLRQIQRGHSPADVAGAAQEYREKLVEAVAESDEKLMEKFFETGSLSDEEIMAGLKKQVAEAKIYPVLYTSATGNIGIQPLLNAILNLAAGRTARGNGNGKRPAR